MNPPQEKEGPADIPTQVFNEFLGALRQATVSPDIIARLSKTLLHERTFTERALKAAVLAEETLS